VSRGLVIPPIFFGIRDNAPVLDGLRGAFAQCDVSHPYSDWFVADNLITVGKSRGFLTADRFTSAVLDSSPDPKELAIAWRTHVLCWAAESCLGLDGDYVECGSYQGYSAEVILRYTDGLGGKAFYLYDLFNPSGGDGEGHRLPAHSDGLHERVRRRLAGFPHAVVTQGKVPEVLAQTSPAKIAFLHIDMNNADAELGALEMLFDRIVAGGIIVFDDYGWKVYGDQKRREDAFATQRGYAILELPTGQGLLIKR